MNSVSDFARICRQSMGANPPASDRDVQRLRDTFSTVPDELLALYAEFNGSTLLPPHGDTCFVARLLPIDELLATNADLSTFDFATLGAVIWAWTDDNSNYAGVYVDGPLQGWLTCLWHEEPRLVPSHRTTASFLSQLIGATTGNSERKRSACDLPSLARDVPVVVETMHAAEDLKLARMYRRLYDVEFDDDLKGLYAFTSICLTPPAETSEVLSFLRDPDMWTPEAAIRLLELRDYKKHVEQIEELARNGTPNGDSAAMRLLARMQTNESRAAIARLRATLEPTKLQSLEMWLRRVLPPQWP